MKHWKRATIAWALAVALALGMLALPVRAEGNQPIAEAGARDQTVRVYLSRLGLTNRMDLSLASSYGLELAGGKRIHFPKDSNIAILLRNGALYLYYQDMSMELGQTVNLTRYDDGEGDGGFRLTNYPALYQGDLRIDIAEGCIRPILSLHVEDYLLGVVPYEMSDSFPVEALKAQAVAARTYALRKQSPGREYDVVDTTNDQVYKGRMEGNEKVEFAVRETRGICGFYKGELAQCYYAASNGGQTERVETVWPTNQDYDYYAFGEDPYDVENPVSVVRRLALQKHYGEGETAPYALRKLLADELNTRGFDVTPKDVRVNAVSDVSVDTPDREGSKRMTMFRLRVDVSWIPRGNVALHMDPDTEDVSLFEVVEPPVGAMNETAAPNPTPTHSSAPITRQLTLEMPIFPTVEQALAMNISTNYDNEIWSVAETKEMYTIEARRYGHGVGMSQRGAQWMAGAYGKNYQEILAFYYPGLTLMRFPEQPRTQLVAEEPLIQTPGPAPSPTPRPTLMPAEQPAEDGQWYAVVTGIDDDSSLNLRSSPDLNGEVLMRLYKHQRLLVLERCDQEGWVKVRTDVAEGYVVESYLTNEAK